MAYADKCCGVCGDYQDLRFCSDGKLYNDYWEERGSEDVYRFSIANVCVNCLSNKPLWGVKARDIEFSASQHRDSRSLRQPKSWFWVDYGYKVVAEYVEEWRVDWINKKEGLGKPCLYYSDHEKISGLVYDEDKRRLRKTLRKLGVKGDLSRVIK